MICTEIKAVRPLPISACTGIITIIYEPYEFSPEDVRLQLQDRHGNQYDIEPTLVDEGEPYYVATFDLSDFPQNFMGGESSYLLRLLNIDYCFNGIALPECASDIPTELYETLSIQFTTATETTWLILQ